MDKISKNQVWLKRFPRLSIVTSLFHISKIAPRFLDVNVKLSTCLKWHVFCYNWSFFLKSATVFFKESPDLFCCYPTFLIVMYVFFRSEFFYLCLRNPFAPTFLPWPGFNSEWPDFFNCNLFFLVNRLLKFLESEKYFKKN